MAIVGPTNAGKSSLLNVLIGDNRAIVSDIHGTTRDTIEETLELGDYLFRFIDTAGLRDTEDPVEKIGIGRSRKAIDASQILIIMVDATADDYLSIIKDTLPTPLPSDRHIIIALNKTDLHPSSGILNLGVDIQELKYPARIIPISTKTGEGIQVLISALKDIASETDSDQILITSQRQAQSLADASVALQNLLSGLQASATQRSHDDPIDPETIDSVNNNRVMPLSETLPTDLLAMHLREAIHHLSSITDPITTPDILNTIFQSFCIGK